MALKFVLICLPFIITITVAHQCRVSSKDTVPVTNILAMGQEMYGESGNKPGFPCWFNVELARLGQRFVRKNFIQVNFGHGLGLLPLLGNQQSRRVLYSTHRSNTPETAFKRYTATGLHINLWYKADILSPTWLKSALTIRKIHDGAGKYFNSLQESNETDFQRPLLTKENNLSGFEPNTKLWEAFEADLEESKYALMMENKTLKEILNHHPKEFYNQFLFSITQWAFVAMPILFPAQLMIPRWTEMELQGFAHLWAVLSYVLGMDEKFILCRDPNDFKGCKKYLEDMFYMYIVPSLFNIDYEGQVMSEAVLRLPQKLIPAVPVDIALIILLEDILGTPAKHLYQQAGWQTRTTRWSMKNFGEAAFHWPIVQRMANFLGIGELQVASLKSFEDPGTNLSAVAEGLYYLD